MSPSDSGSDKIREASPEVFESGQPSSLEGDSGGEVEGTFGDSRPDETEPRENAFEEVADEAMLRTMRDPRDMPTAVKEDPEYAEENRAVQEEQIAARPVGPLDAPGQVLEPSVDGDPDAGENR
jgi:hypothetical protein